MLKLPVSLRRRPNSRLLMKSKVAGNGQFRGSLSAQAPARSFEGVIKSRNVLFSDEPCFYVMKL